MRGGNAATGYLGKKGSGKRPSGPMPLLKNAGAGMVNCP